MNLIQAIESGLRNYVNFTGRSARSEYWYWQLFNSVTTASLVAIDGRLNSGETLGVFSAITALVILGLYLPTLAISARRLHDVDRSAWWILASLTVVGIIPLLYWACSRGTLGANRFGSDPLGVVATSKPRVRMTAA